MQDDINLLAFWAVLLKWKKRIGIIVLFFVFAGLGLALILPKTYRAESVIIPSGGQKNGFGISSQINSLLGNIGNTSSSSSQIMAILKSRTLAETIIERYGLMKIFFPKSWDEKGQQWLVKENQQVRMTEKATAILSSMVTFNDDKKNQIIIIQAVTRDPALSSKLANDYVAELAKFIQNNALTDAKRNRIFIESQLARNKAELLRAGKELSEFYSMNKISNTRPTLDVDLSLEDHVDELQDIPDIPQATPAAADFRKMKIKAANLKNQMNDIHQQILQTKMVEDIPQQVYLNYLTLRREFLSQVNGLLIQQYEMAKIEESREDLTFQILDKARTPSTKYKPKRTEICVKALALGLFFACAYVFFQENLAKQKKST